MNVKKGVHHPMEVEFSMGINVVNRADPNDTTLPDISFISRNQTMLWIPDSALKSKGRGIIVLTCSYIPDIQTPDQLAIVEEQTVDIQHTRNDSPSLDKAPAIYNASLSLLVGAADVAQEKKEKPNWMKQIVRKLKPKSTPGSQLADLPLYEVKARGWDVTLNQWRLPVYPTLDAKLHNVTEDSSPAWKLVVTSTEAQTNHPASGSKEKVSQESSERS
ncbi:hypothetical protein C8R43DRAFT_452278 [Mycena crocata]|nr:hypothetical protein C8R43DRAFT_452278 [Mycena crocata]